MSQSKRQKDRALASLGSDYVDRMFKSPSKDKSTSAKTNARSSSTGGKKSSRITKEYVQAYEWSQKELMKSRNKTKKGIAASKPKSPPLTTSSLSTRRFTPREPLSPVTFHETLASDDERFDETQYQHYSERSVAPKVSPRYHRIREPPSTTSMDRRKPSRRSGLMSIAPILLGITFIALCEHTSHILMRTNLLSDLGLQFTAFFLKASFQVLIVMHILSRAHRDGGNIGSGQPRGFRDFMHSQGGTMIEANKLRAWFGEAAVFDPQFLTKLTDENRCEFWQWRPHG